MTEINWTKAYELAGRSFPTTIDEPTPRLERETIGRLYSVRIDTTKTSGTPYLNLCFSTPIPDLRVWMIVGPGVLLETLEAIGVDPDPLALVDTNGDVLVTVIREYMRGRQWVLTIAESRQRGRQYVESFKAR